MTAWVIETKNLTKRYKKGTALASVNLKIEKGCIYGLVGRNGAGKTTLLKLLAGHALPSEGQIHLFGAEGNLNRPRRRIGTIVEHPAFFPELTGHQNLEYYRIQKGILEKNAVDKAIKDMGLQELAGKKYKEYSLGNKQRLGLALALLGNPDLLLLDEPINGFDPIGIGEIRKLLLELNQKRHITILISSHNLPELENLMTRVGFIHHGHLIEELDMNQLQEKCQTHIQLQVDKGKKAVAVLEQQLSIHHYEVLPDQVLKIYGEKQLIPHISRVLNQNGIQVYGLKEVGVSLEEYFTGLVGDDK